MHLHALARTAFASCALVAAACAEEVSPFGGGGLAFRDLDVSFAPRIVYSGWKGQARSTAGKDAASFAFDLSDGPGGSVNGRLESCLDGDGAVAARWTFTPSTNAWVEECGLLACLPVYRYADGSLEADGTSVHLAKDYGKALQFRGRVSKLAFRDAHGRETFALAFPEPADVLVQDSRGWKCPWFEFRILLGHRLAAGKTVKTGFRLIVPKGGPVKLNPPGKYVPAASEEWRPIAFPSQVEPGSAVDFTSFAVSHTPAGKYGYAVVRDGHFEFEKLPGVPQRFYGINVCYGDCYPDSPEKADGMASFFAACGYNAIRLHHYDFKVTVGKGGVAPDESLLRRMDSLVDACVRHGLYITTDLFCSRGHSVAWRDVGIDADGTIDWSYKAMAILHAGTTENLKQFTRNFLCHRNVYTGRRLADEPALSWISLINEGMLAHHPTPKAGTTAYAVMSGIWKSWLEKKHAEGAFADVACDLPAEARVRDDTPVSRALRAFYAEKEASFAATMRCFLREEIGCKALLTSLNSGVPPAEYAAFRQANFDSACRPDASTTA